MSHEKNINFHYHHHRSSDFEANKMLMDTKQNWIWTEGTCNRLVNSCTNSQASPVSNYLMPEVTLTLQERKTSWVSEITRWTWKSSSRVYNVIWTKSLADHGYSKRETNLLWTHIAFLLRFIFLCTGKDWLKSAIILVTKTYNQVVPFMF